MRAARKLSRLLKLWGGGCQIATLPLHRCGPKPGIVW